MNLTVGVNNPNALSRQVAQAVHDGGQLSTDDLALMFPRFQRQQIHKALMNAKDRGWVFLAKRGTGGRYGSVAGLWAACEGIEPPVRPAKPKHPKPAASVWELGNRVACAKWPPKFEGGRVYVSLEEETEAA